MSEREMSVMDPAEGDIKIVWDSENEDEVRYARETFDRYTKDKRMTAFRVDKKGKQAKVMTEFDEDAEAMILAPIVSGG